LSVRLLLVGLLAALALAACDQEQGEALLTGYVEGELVDVGAPAAGWIEEQLVREGDEVAPGQLLFRLDAERELAQVDDARARLLRARAEGADLAKGRRPEEIDELEARLAQARASLAFAEEELTRQQALVGTTAALRRNRERAEADVALYKARVAEARSAIAVARMPARDDLLQAAAAGVEAAEAALREAEWRLDQRRVLARVAGRVETLVRRQGEYVAAGAPVIELLPPESLEVRVFVPEPALARLALGQSLWVGCDGCARTLEARISFIAASAEFTPPVIYSLERREKLVYLVKARPPVGSGLRPGQPVDVSLETRP